MRGGRSLWRDRNARMIGLSAIHSGTGNRADWNGGNQPHGARAGVAACGALLSVFSPPTIVCKNMNSPVRRNDMRIRASLAVALFVVAGCGGALAAEPTGTWLTQSGTSRIKVADCGGA